MKSSFGNLRRNGFTLLELLVVMVVLVALGALSFQGFRVARIRANQAVSATNLRQLATANLFYAAEHQTYVPASERFNRVRWHGARTSSKSKFDPRGGYLAEYLGESQTVGMCPEFKRHLSDAASFENGSGGYGYNATYIGGMPNDTFTPNRPTNVPNPARTIMFATTALVRSSGLQEYPFAEPPRSVDFGGELSTSLQPSVHFRFNGKALIAWCDGHLTEERPNSERGASYYGGNNKKSDVGFCGPTANNGWWNPKN